MPTAVVGAFQYAPPRLVFSELRLSCLSVGTALVLGASALCASAIWHLEREREGGEEVFVVLCFL